MPESDLKVETVDDDEYEITPEMMAAGLRAYNNRDNRFYHDWEIVEDIYLAMASSRYFKSGSE